MATESVGERIRKLRGKKTQTAFGIPYEASKQTVRNWESGRNLPKSDALLKMAGEYNQTVEGILTGDGFRDPTEAAKKGAPPIPFKAMRDELEITDPKLMIRRSLKVLGIMDDEVNIVMTQVEYFATKAAPSLRAAKDAIKPPRVVKGQKP